MSVEAQVLTFGPNPPITDKTDPESVEAIQNVMEAAAELLDPEKYEALVHGTRNIPDGHKPNGGPRRPRTHNARLLGSRAFTEAPAKSKRQRRNKAQRQARKANRGR